MNLLSKPKAFLFETQNFVFRTLLRKRFVATNSKNMTFLGNSYSGYWLPREMVEKKGTIWGVGLGRDSSFELELVNKGYRFLGFEPHSECFSTSVAQFKDTNAEIFNFGIWDRNGWFSFTGENISIVDIFDIGMPSEERLQIKSLWEVAAELELETMPKPRILKVNIEGAEREILRKFTQEELPFTVIIFQAEFLFHIGFRKIGKKIRAFLELFQILKILEEKSWTAIDISRHQITLVR
jgi:FkbM family methyltransferase